MSWFRKTAVLHACPGNIFESRYSIPTEKEGYYTQDSPTVRTTRTVTIHQDQEKSKHFILQNLKMRFCTQNRLLTQMDVFCCRIEESVHCYKGNEVQRGFQDTVPHKIVRDTARISSCFSDFYIQIFPLSLHLFLTNSSSIIL